MNYPSIKIIGMIVVALLIIGGSLAFSQHLKQQAQVNVVRPESIVTTVATSTIVADSINTDTDEDGLKDWEEVLWGTDPIKKDTDGDNVSDGQEVIAGQNPTIKGTGKTSAAAAATKAQNLTETDKFGRELFAQYLQLRKFGLSADADSQEQLVQNLLNSGTLSQTAKIYSNKDLVILAGTSKELVKQYGNAVGSILSTYSIKSRSEPVIVKESLDNNDDSVLKELDPIIASYQKILNMLLQTPVPNNLKEVHLHIVNSTSAALFSAQSFKKLGSDPILTLQSIAGYPATTQALRDAILDLKNYLSINSITYDSREAGYIFSGKKQ